MAILIVEDNATNALILKHLARKATDVEVIVEADPTRALELCHNQVFDLLILDQMLPGMTGVHFTKVIRMNARYDAVPVVMVTADVSPELREEALSAGVSRFLTKPVEALAFRNLVSGFLGERASGTCAAG